MTPYYEHGGITIYHGDCRDVLEEWEGLRTQSFDLLLTDPPYGIGINKSHRLSVSRGFGLETWDDTPADAVIIGRIRAICRQAIIWGGNYFDLPPTRCFLIWDKENADRDFADCELAWTNLDAVARRICYRPMNMDGGKLHPTQKPEAVMRWCLRQSVTARSVLDPFMGSGTTLVAAKRLGRQCVGIEREERYCEIAAKRLAQDVPLGDEKVVNEPMQAPLLAVE
jgi:DNA modification methylase